MGPRGSWEVKASRFYDMALEGGRLSAIRTGRLYPQEYPGTYFKSLIRYRAHGIVECYGKKFPVTPPEIEPGTFRLVAWCFNHYATRSRTSCRILLCSLTPSNTLSFLTWSIQLIFSNLLQHHISKLSRYFWSAARSCFWQLWAG
jgi:hypothetical protein